MELSRVLALRNSSPVMKGICQSKRIRVGTLIRLSSERPSAPFEAEKTKKPSLSKATLSIQLMPGSSSIIKMLCNRPPDSHCPKPHRTMGFYRRRNEMYISFFLRSLVPFSWVLTEPIKGEGHCKTTRSPSSKADYWSCQTPPQASERSGLDARRVRGARFQELATSPRAGGREEYHARNTGEGRTTLQNASVQIDRRIVRPCAAMSSAKRYSGNGPQSRPSGTKRWCQT